MRRWPLLLPVLATVLFLSAAYQSGQVRFSPAAADSRPVAAASAIPTASPSPIPVDLSRDVVHYQVTERMTLVNRGDGQPAKQNVWIALISDIEPYQEVLAMEISPATYRTVVDEYGNRYAEFDFSDMPPGSRMEIKASYQVAVHKVEADLSTCQGDLPDFFTQPELHVESANPQIIELAQQLSQGQPTACDQAQAFYHHVANNLVYTYNRGDWGAQATLGEMGADCTEFASLMMALSRAAGIPARYLEGLYYTPSESDDLARTEHSWLEVFLPGAGWVPMDPTLGRSSMTRTTYFAAIPPNHIIVTRGRNPSTLRGSSYWTHLYWPGNSTDIQVEDFGWNVQPLPSQP